MEPAVGELTGSRRGAAFGVARRRMVAELAARGVRDERVLRAMGEIPRHEFVDPAVGRGAYGDRAIPIGLGQTLSHFETAARLSEALALGGSERVLEIGTGSGYQTALLASLAREVWTVERLEPLHRRARETLCSLGYGNVRFLWGDGSFGWPEGAPYDRILFTAAAPGRPLHLVTQLDPEGWMVYPRAWGSEQRLILARRENGSVRETDLGACRFVPLVREAGGPEGDGGEGS
jgi:protein-L-isoaspartate(D-aspartate) O-methyltransferase